MYELKQERPEKKKKIRNKHTDKQVNGASAVMQMQRAFLPAQLPDPVVNYTTLQYDRLTLPARMVARNLNDKIMRETDSKITQHSDVKVILDKLGYSSNYHDGHLLNHKLGGAGAPPNLIPVTPDANHQMSIMENTLRQQLEADKGMYSVADYDVTVNYGRSDGKLPAEKAIPTSWDMRYTMKEFEGGSWRDYGDTMIQNVKIGLNHKPKHNPLVPCANVTDVQDKGMISKYSPEEIERRRKYRSFLDTGAWAGRRIFGGEQDIVSADLVSADLNSPREAWKGDERFGEEPFEFSGFDEESFPLLESYPHICLSCHEDFYSQYERDGTCPACLSLGIVK